MSTIDERVAKIERDYPLVLHSGAGRLFSTVKRMRAEKELNIPVSRRIGVANTEQEWEKSYIRLAGQLKREYPELSLRALSEDDDFDERSFRKSHGMSRE